MSKRNLKGLWLPAEILLDEKLADKEKFVLSMILYLSDETGSCFASNQYIATIVKVTPNRVSKIISSLKNKNYIQVILKYKNDSKEIEQRQIIPIVQMNNGYSQNKQEGIVENNNSDSQKRQSPIGESDKDIINNIKSKNNYNNESHIKKNNKANFEQRDYTGFDFTKLYANASAFL
ncbi:MAG: helix-turn-helix domain-containing protein [Clostridia bacterium]